MKNWHSMDPSDPHYLLFLKKLHLTNQSQLNSLIAPYSFPLNTNHSLQRQEISVTIHIRSVTLGRLSSPYKKGSCLFFLLTMAPTRSTVPDIQKALPQLTPIQYINDEYQYGYFFPLIKCFLLETLLTLQVDVSFFSGSTKVKVSHLYCHCKKKATTFRQSCKVCLYNFLLKMLIWKK